MIAAFTLGLRSLRSREAAGTAIFAAFAAFVLTLMLGLAAQLPAALHAADRRADARYPADAVVGQRSTPIAQRSTVWRGHSISVIEVADPKFTPPPGVRQLPAVGDSVVSPQLARLMRQPSARRELSPRVGQPVGQIQPAGLRDPEELFAYVGTTPAAIKAVSAFRIGGWGIREGLFASPISPLVAIPLAIAILLPASALAAGLVRLDAGRRERRLASVGLLGGGPAHLVAIDLGFLFPPVAIGWLTASLLRRQAFGGLIVRALHGGDFFASDLDVGMPVALACLLLLVVLITPAAIGAVRPKDALVQAQTAQPAPRLQRTIGAGVLSVVGLVAILFVINNRNGSELRSPLPPFGAAGAFVVGVLMLVEPLALAVGRLWRRCSVAGNLAVGQLGAARRSWRSTVTSLVLAGFTVAVTMSVLVVLDVSRQTDQLIWRPEEIAPTTAYADLTAADLTTVTQRLGRRNVVPLLGTTYLTLTRSGGRPMPITALLVPCGRTGQLTRAGTSCGRPTIGPAATAVRGPVMIRDSTGHVVSTGTEQRARISALVEIAGGSDALLLPVPAGYLTDRLQHLAPGELVKGVLTVRDPGQLETLRNLTWPDAADAISGADSPLSSIVSKSDLIIDSQYYVDSFTALTITLVGAGLGTAFLAAACSAAVEARVQRGRDAILLSLGTTTGTLWRARLLATVTPLAVGALLTSFAGGLLGYLYLSYARDFRSDGALHGFPAATYLEFTIVETVLILVVSLACQRLIVGPPKRLNASAIRVLNA